jgi:hypothetical protein
VTRFTFTYSIVETQAIASAISGAGTWNKLGTHNYYRKTEKLKQNE